MSSCVPQGCVVQNCELGVCRVSPQMLLQKLCCPELWVSFITWFWSCNWERHGCTKSVAAWVVGMARCKCGNEWEGMHVVCCLLSMVLISKQQDNVSWLRIFWKTCKTSAWEWPHVWSCFSWAKHIMFTETLTFVRQVKAESAVMDPSNIRVGILSTSNNA